MALGLLSAGVTRLVATMSRVRTERHDPIIVALGGWRGEVSLRPPFLSWGEIGYGRRRAVTYPGVSAAAFRE